MTKEQSDRVPFDMGLDPAMDSPEFFSKRAPEAVFIPAGSASRDAYGHRYGSELLELDDVMLDKLQQGQQLAVEICQGEYILFVQYRSKEINIHEKCALRQGDDSMRQLRQRFIREKGSNGSFTVLPFGTKGSRYSILL